ncbi:MAG TPA: tripartite tricarboxylate transporter substrate-binding protein [Burkholderiaceae bacterium]|nr:tripartite tricarboxylate transporter substrate-binding protein [Burkholderiaceae bacterium]
MHRRRILQGAALGALPWPLRSFAQGDAPLRIIVPYGAGGTTDLMARAMAPSLCRELRRNVIVENKAGASGLIATRALQTAPADGSTMILHNEGMALLPLIQRSVGYDMVRDFSPVSVVARTANYLVIHHSVPANNLAEFIEWVKSQPAGVEAANAGLNSSGYIQTLLFAKMAGIKVVHIPYKGTSETTNALISGEVKMQLTTRTEILNTQIKAGRLKVLGTAAAKRLSFDPDLPTIGETVRGFSAGGWFGLLTNAGVPAEAVAQLNKAVVTVMAEPDTRNRFFATSVEPASSTVEAFAEEIRTGIDRWARVIAEEKIPVSG